MNRLVSGHNMEAPGAANYDKSGIKFGQGFRSASARKPYAGTLDFMQTIKPGMMRYPGGCLAHNYDWKKAVGPLRERGDWQFGIDEYIKLCCF